MQLSNTTHDKENATPRRAEASPLPPKTFPSCGVLHRFDRVSGGLSTPRRSTAHNASVASRSPFSPLMLREPSGSPVQQQSVRAAQLDEVNRQLDGIMMTSPMLAANKGVIDEYLPFSPAVSKGEEVAAAMPTSSTARSVYRVAAPDYKIDVPHASALMPLQHADEVAANIMSAGSKGGKSSNRKNVTFALSIDAADGDQGRCQQMRHWISTRLSLLAALVTSSDSPPEESPEEASSRRKRVVVIRGIIVAVLLGGLLVLLFGVLGTVGAV